MKTLFFKKIFFTVFLFVPVIASAQLNYNFHVSYGFSNLRETNKETAVQVGNYYTKLPSYSFGCGLYVPIKESKFQLLSGIDFLSLASKNHMPDDFNTPGYTGPKSWEERFYSVSVPLCLSYKFERWISLNVGFTNTIHINEPENMTDKKINHYTIGFTGGVDFIIKKRYTIGVNYYRDIIPTAKLLQLPSNSETYKISFPFEQLNIRLGVLLHKTE